MGYTSGKLRSLELDLSTAGNLIPFPSDRISYKGLPLIPYKAKFRPKNIFSNDTFGNDPALVKATGDFYEAWDELVSQMLKDGLTPAGLPKDVRAEDLGESLDTIPTIYGIPAIVPVGTTKGFCDPDEKKQVFNRRIIYGTKEQEESKNLYKAALKFVEKYAIEPVKKILKPFYKKKIDTMESESKSRKEFKETGIHENKHIYQGPVIKFLLKKYGKLTDYVRDVIEKHCIRYTSRVLKRRSTDKESGYGRLEDQAIKSETKKRIGPEDISRTAERDPKKAAQLAEMVYGYPVSMN